MTDQKIRNGFEKVSNEVSRRRFLRKAIQSVFATLAALAASQTDVKRVLAVPSCCYSPTACSNCPSISGGAPYCPSGYSICTTANCSVVCNYASGYWYCNPEPSITVRCTDCWNGSSCNSFCTCHKIVSCCE